MARISHTPENDDIYKPIALDSPDISDLARSIEEDGVQEPLLVSTDGYVISGHRRRVAAILAGLTEVPVRVYPVSREPCFNDLVVSDNNLPSFGS